MQSSRSAMRAPLVVSAPSPRWALRQRRSVPMLCPVPSGLCSVPSARPPVRPESGPEPGPAAQAAVRCALRRRLELRRRPRGRTEVSKGRPVAAGLSWRAHHSVLLYRERCTEQVDSTQTRPVPNDSGANAPESPSANIDPSSTIRRSTMKPLPCSPRRRRCRPRSIWLDCPCGRPLLTNHRHIAVETEPPDLTFHQCPAHRIGSVGP